MKNYEIIPLLVSRFAIWDGSKFICEVETIEMAEKIIQALRLLEAMEKKRKELKKRELNASNGTKS